jgi:hypothetical protein
VAGDLVQGVAEGPSKCCVADVDQFETRSPEKLGELIVDVLPEIWVSNTDHLRRAFFYVRHPDFPFRGKPYSPYYTSSPIVRFADFWWLAVTALGARQERFMAGGPPSTTFVYTIPAQDAPRW